MWKANRRVNAMRPVSETVLLSGVLRGSVGGAVFPCKGRAWRPNRHANRIPDYSVVEVAGALQEELLGRLVPTVTVAIGARLNEQLRGGANLAAGIELSGLLSEALTGSANGLTAVEVAGILQEALGGGAHLGANVYLAGTLRETLEGAAHLGAEVYLAHGLQEQLRGNAHLGADVYLVHSLYETLNGYVHIGHLSEQNAFFHGSIPPGGELVVDSDNYIVLLNGENAIAQYSGDWIFVSRPTVNLTLSIPGSRGYSWEVFYIERYL